MLTPFAVLSCRAAAWTTACARRGSPPPQPFTPSSQAPPKTTLSLSRFGFPLSIHGTKHPNISGALSRPSASLCHHCVPFACPLVTSPDCLPLSCLRCLAPRCFPLPHPALTPGPPLRTLLLVVFPCFSEQPRAAWRAVTQLSPRQARGMPRTGANNEGKRSLRAPMDGCARARFVASDRHKPRDRSRGVASLPSSARAPLLVGCTLFEIHPFVHPRFGRGHTQTQQPCRLTCW